MLTFGQAKEILRQYASRAGRCSSDDALNLFVLQILQYMLFSGAYGNLRKFTFNAVRGCFTVPHELETALKVKIDCEVGSVWDKWFEWHNDRDLEGKCFPAGEALYEEPNRYPTVYDLVYPSRVGVLGICDESCDAHVIVTGEDPTGREIFTTHKGEQISGEYLTITKGQIKFTTVEFGKITGILKSKTKGYVQLLAVNPTVGKTYFLSDYTPLEEKPAYRRYKLTSKNCARLLKVSVLGRIRLKEAYADTDFIPFENLYALQVAGQSINLQYNNDVQGAQAKDQIMQDLITRENEYKRVENGQPMEVFKALSPGAVKNIVS